MLFRYLKIELSEKLASSCLSTVYAVLHIQLVTLRQNTRSAVCSTEYNNCVSHLFVKAGHEKRRSLLTSLNTWLELIISATRAI